MVGYCTRMEVPFETLIDSLTAAARSDRDAWDREGWARVSAAIAGRSREFLEWIREHRRWSFILAEAAAEVCAKPPEAAAWVLHEVVEEQL